MNEAKLKEQIRGLSHIEFRAMTSLLYLDSRNALAGVEKSLLRLAETFRMTETSTIKALNSLEARGLILKESSESRHLPNTYHPQVSLDFFVNTVIEELPEVAVRVEQEESE